MWAVLYARALSDGAFAGELTDYVLLFVAMFAAAYTPAACRRSSPAPLHQVHTHAVKST
jgi:hypothetical protein